MRRNKQTQGFTVVEIVATIVVIGILTSIVLVVYPNYLKQTRDNARKSDLEQISSALNAYAIKNGTFMTTGSNCGYQNNGNGWFNKGPDANYATTINQCLKTNGQLKTDIIDPTKCTSDTGGACGTTAVTAYMKATCTTGGVNATYVFARMEASSPQTAAAIDALCDAGSVSGFTSATQKWGSLYGMNYYEKVQ